MSEWTTVASASGSTQPEVFISVPIMPFTKLSSVFCGRMRFPGIVNDTALHKAYTWTE
jgi:hypothetical protein